MNTYIRAYIGLHTTIHTYNIAFLAGARCYS